jgi:hypothetical protein
VTRKPKSMQCLRVLKQMRVGDCEGVADVQVEVDEGERLRVVVGEGKEERRRRRDLERLGRFEWSAASALGCGRPGLGRADGRQTG